MATLAGMAVAADGAALAITARARRAITGAVLDGAAGADLTVAITVASMAASMATTTAASVALAALMEEMAETVGMVLLLLHQLLLQTALLLLLRQPSTITYQILLLLPLL